MHQIQNGSKKSETRNDEEYNHLEDTKNFNAAQIESSVERDNENMYCLTASVDAKTVSFNDE